MKKGDRIAWVASESAAHNAAARLPGLVSEYFSAGRKITGGSADLDEYHRFRIRTKRLRYTLELFRPCYGPAMDRRLEALRGIQQCLGEMNDYATIREMIQDAEIISGLDRLMEAKAKDFAALWNDRFDRPGEESRWTRYLSRPTSVRPGPV